MAAVEQPVSISESSIPQRRRRRPSADVIDVDLLDDDDIQRPFRRRRPSEFPTAGSSANIHDTITILDSDDDTITILESDNEQPASSVPAAHRGRRSFFSPPPPPQSISAPPPVPRIPRQFARSSFPMRRRPPDFPSSGVIRPNQEPFPFEAHIRSAAPDHDPPPPIAAAPPSHHEPSMSLGGALISFNQSFRENARRRDEQLRRRRNLEQNIGRRVSSLYRAAIRLSGEHFIGTNVRVDEDEVLARILAAEEADVDPRSAYPDHLHRSPAEKPQYLPSFTHPGKPAPGFTYDFGPLSASSSPKTANPPIIDVDEGPVASTSAVKVEDASTLLVCARCLDPLVLGGSDARTKLWGLRCGHLIDGKCLDEIMRLPPTADGEDKAVKATDATPARQIGKGKQKEVEASNEGSRMTNSAPDHEREASPIRLRLRPRHHPLHVSTQAAGPSTSRYPTRTVDLGFQRYRRRRRRHSSGMAKGKDKDEESVVEASREWACPVPGCGRVHISLFVGGRWVPDSDRGAIAVYA